MVTATAGLGLSLGWWVEERSRAGGLPWVTFKSPFQPKLLSESPSAGRGEQGHGGVWLAALS